MFLFLNSDVTLLCVKIITFRLVQEGFLGSKINLNLPNVIKSPCRPTKCVYGSHDFKVILCAKHEKWMYVINTESLFTTIVK